MKINFDKTRKRLQEEGYSIKGYASSPARQLNYTSFYQLLTGHWLPKTTEGAEFNRIVNQLRTDGLLVEEPDGEPQEAA